MKKNERNKIIFEKTSSYLLYIGFVLFFCTLLYEPVFNVVNSRIEDMSVFAFGIILAGQYYGNYSRNKIQNNGEELSSLNEKMELINNIFEKRKNIPQ